MDHASTADMRDKQFIFIAGLHRSGTSMLHEIIRAHPAISGFSGTGVPEDEGQLLQSVYEPARTFGGPARFAFDRRAYMDERHPLATEESAKALYAQWAKYWQTSCTHLVEKSPPNIIRTRFLQKLFPESKFIVILRHPIAVAYATKKWRKSMPLRELLEHTLLAYEIFQKDRAALRSSYVLKYEDLVASPQATVDKIFDYLKLPTIKVDYDVRSNVNQQYFTMWERDRAKWTYRMFNALPAELEARANRLGYSINDCVRNVSVPGWFEAADRSAHPQPAHRPVVAVP